MDQLIIEYNILFSTYLYFKDDNLYRIEYLDYIFIYYTNLGINLDSTVINILTRLFSFSQSIVDAINNRVIPTRLLSFQ